MYIETQKLQAARSYRPTSPLLDNGSRPAVASGNSESAAAMAPRRTTRDLYPSGDTPGVPWLPYFPGESGSGAR